MENKTTDPRINAILNAASAKEGDDYESLNLWECMIEFVRLAKAVDSPWKDRALKAAGYATRLHSAVSLPNDPPSA